MERHDTCAGQPGNPETSQYLCAYQRKMCICVLPCKPVTWINAAYILATAKYQLTGLAKGSTKEFR